MSRVGQQQSRALSAPITVIVDAYKGCGRTYRTVAVVKHVQQPGGAPCRCRNCGQINRHDRRLDQQRVDDCGGGEA